MTSFLAGYYPTEADWGDQTEERKSWYPILPWIVVGLIILYFTLKII